MFTHKVNTIKICVFLYRQTDSCEPCEAVGPEDPSLHQRRRHGRRSGKAELDDCAFWRDHHNNCYRHSNQNDVIHPSNWAWATCESPRPSQNGENVTKVTVIL